VTHAGEEQPLFPCFFVTFNMPAILKDGTA